MKPTRAGLLVTALTTFATAATAQTMRFGVGAGLTAPSGDYATIDKAGWHVLGKVAVDIPLTPFTARVDGVYGQTTHKAPATGHTSLAGGLASLVWHIPTAAPLMKPYLLAGAGVYNVKITASETKFAFGAGGGVAVGHGATHFSVEARYVSIKASNASLNFIPITATVTFGGK